MNPKRETVATMDQKLSSTPNDFQSCLLGAGKFYQPDSPRLTHQRELNEEVIKYGDEMTKKKSRGSQWGVGFYGYRLKFWHFYGYRFFFSVKVNKKVKN